MERIAWCAVFTLSLLSVVAVARADTETVAIERASGETLSSAMGHYARARSLLIAAIREFDSGDQLVSTKAILDVDEWRKDVIGRTQDLDRVLDPQPLATRGGVKYGADTRLLNETKKAQ